jgi:hypothetical protein
MIITRVYDHALGPSSHSSYSFAYNVAEYSLLRTTAAHLSHIQEQIMHRLISEKCLLFQKVSWTLIRPHAGVTLLLHAMVGLYEGRQNENCCRRQRGEGADVMAGLTNCVRY